MDRISAIALILAIITGCATPATMLKNETTGQIARCGGGTAGSVAGGLIGYTIEKSSDEECVRAFEAKGFRRGNDNIAARPQEPETRKSVAVSSKYAFRAEAFAKAKGCVMPVSNLNFKTPDSETFSITCSKGEPLSVRCESGQCRALQ